jgi:hypothetical protein
VAIEILEISLCRNRKNLRNTFIKPMFLRTGPAIFLGENPCIKLAELYPTQTIHRSLEQFFRGLQNTWQSRVVISWKILHFLSMKWNAVETIYVKLSMLKAKWSGLTG